jgi:hypothetical protein
VNSGPRQGFRWTEELIVYAIDLWHRSHLRTPTVEEWETAGDNHPSRATVQRRFGSWSAAMRAAGFRPRSQGEYARPWSRRRCPDTGRWIAEKA